MSGKKKDAGDEKNKIKSNEDKQKQWLRYLRWKICRIKGNSDNTKRKGSGGVLQGERKRGEGQNTPLYAGKRGCVGGGTEGGRSVGQPSLSPPSVRGKNPY